MCIDKSLNLGVELENEKIVIRGEILNESLQIDIKVTSEKLHDLCSDDTPGLLIIYRNFFSFTIKQTVHRIYTIVQTRIGYLCQSCKKIFGMYEELYGGNLGD